MPLKETKIGVLLRRVRVSPQDRHLLRLSCLFQTKQGYISRRQKRAPLGKRHMFLHHLIVGKPPKGFMVDHKNGDKLDNRRSNLHIVSSSYNLTNRLKRKDSTQKYRGIQQLPSGRYSAKTSGGMRLGTFDTPEDAFKCYKKFVFLKFNKPIYVTTS